MAASVVNIMIAAHDDEPLQMTTFKPRKLFGAWSDGYALDLHTTGSSYVGDDEFGHPRFETQRTELGELLFKLKYRSDVSVVEPLTEVAADFVRTWRIEPNLIVPVPATRTYRTVQPVRALAESMGRRLGLPVDIAMIRKKKQYSELKNVYDAEERRQLLQGAFDVNGDRAEGRRILLVDDLYRSGATMNAISEVLLTAEAEAVFVLAFTQTRSRA